MTLLNPEPPEDPLAALTVIRAKCKCCGQNLYSSWTEETKEEMWAVCCECGHTMPVLNLIKWQ